MADHGVVAAGARLTDWVSLGVLAAFVPRGAVDDAVAAAGKRWEHETGNAQLKTYLHGPGKVLRSRSPDMIRQEIYGYLLTHYTVSALICRAATEAGIDPDRVKFKRTVRVVRRRAADPAAIPPDQQQRILAAIMADITRKKHLDPRRRHRTYPRVVKRARHNSYRVKRPGNHGTRHPGTAAITLVNLRQLTLAA